MIFLLLLPPIDGATTTMNARFPVESGESLSRATTAPAHQPVPIAQRNGSSVVGNKKKIFFFENLHKLFKSQNLTNNNNAFHFNIQHNPVE